MVSFSNLLDVEEYYSRFDSLHYVRDCYGASKLVSYYDKIYEEDIVSGLQFIRREFSDYKAITLSNAKVFYAERFSDTQNIILKQLNDTNYQEYSRLSDFLMVMYSFGVTKLKDIEMFNEVEEMESLVLSFVWRCLENDKSLIKT